MNLICTYFTLFVIVSMSHVLEQATGLFCLSGSSTRVVLEICSKAGGWWRDSEWGSLHYVESSAWNAAEGEYAGLARNSREDVCLTGLKVCPRSKRLSLLTINHERKSVWPQMLST